MDLDVMRRFNVDKDAGKSAYGYAAESVLDQFKVKQEGDREFAQKAALEGIKNMPTAKDKAMTGYYDAQTKWMDSLSGDPGAALGSAPDENGMVIDSIGRSGPRYVNAGARLKQATLLKQAGDLPKLDRALDAVQTLKSQYQRSIQPVSIKKGSNPLVGFAKKQSQGFTQGISSKVGTNPELNRYKANKEGFASLISKGGFMEAGVLTNEDIKRITDILPSEYSSEEEANIAWTEIEGILSQARERFESYGGGIDKPILDPSDMSTGGQTKVINGVTFEKVGGGWKRKTS